MNKWHKFILIIGAWGLFCGITLAPSGVAFVGGLMLGAWYSPLWTDKLEDE